MTVYLSIDIFCKTANNSHLHSMMRKKIDTDITPILGAGIEDYAWKKPKIPVCITCSFEENYYYISFEIVEMPSKEACEQERDMYKLHGWDEARNIK